jgi:hypothetical protein
VKTAIREIAICGSLALLFCCPRQPATAGPALPLSASRYDAILLTVHNDAVLAAGGDLSAEHAAIADIEPISVAPVRTPSGRLVFADNRPIIARMQAADTGNIRNDSAAWSQIAVAIDQTRSSLETGPAPTGASPATEQLRALLATSEYASLPIATRSVWDKIGDWIDKELRALGKLFHMHAPETKTPEWVSGVLPKILLIVICTAAIGLLIYFAAVAIRNRRFATAGDSRGELGLALTAAERDLVSSFNYARLRELSIEASLRGEYRAAFRLTFIALLVFLSLEGAIKLDRSKTNWEYLRAIPSHSDVRAELRPIIKDFDLIWYGDQPATEADFDRASGIYDRIRGIVGDSLASPDSAARKFLKRPTEAT